MVLPYRRSQRLKKVLLIEISNIMRKLKDPRIGFVTLTDIELSDDLDNAKVYFSTIEDRRVPEIERILNTASGYVKRELGHILTIKKMPRITFHYDPTYKRATRIFELFKKISDEKDKGGNKDKQ